MVRPIKSNLSEVYEEEARRERFRKQGYSDFKELPRPRYVGHRYMDEYMQGWNKARKEQPKLKWWERLYIKLYDLFY